jgi:acetyl-CoA carboxylase, biotin carboxylase subunit
VHGIATNVAWLAAALAHPAFRAGTYDTTFCARYERDLLAPPDPGAERLALVAAAIARHRRDHGGAGAPPAPAARAAGPSAWAALGRDRALRGRSR